MSLRLGRRKRIESEDEELRANGRDAFERHRRRERRFSFPGSGFSNGSGARSGELVLHRGLRRRNEDQFRSLMFRDDYFRIFRGRSREWTGVFRFEIHAQRFRNRYRVVLFRKPFRLRRRRRVRFLIRRFGSFLRRQHPVGFLYRTSRERLVEHRIEHHPDMERLRVGAFGGRGVQRHREHDLLRVQVQYELHLERLFLRRQHLNMAIYLNFRQ